MEKVRLNRISIVLDEKGINQKELASLLGSEGKNFKDKISGWCRNRHQPSIPTLYEIAKVLRINIQTLLNPTYWENETSPSPLELLKQRRSQK